jgi:alkanesulfonate monooxygenase SsuD/methylene tetrahydromethanopterin reductase-like flavin-dependent oxidoreductase (luciferase family)
VFVSNDRQTCDRVRSGLIAQAVRMARSGSRLVSEEELLDIENWALVGDLPQVRDGIDRYTALVGMTHLIARCGVPDTAPEEVQQSLRLLAELNS